MSKQSFFGFPWTITEELCKLIDKPITTETFCEPHDCVRNSAEVIDQFLEREGLHNDPVIDTNDNLIESRVHIMQVRLESAELVLKNWLERQEYLFFKRNNGRVPHKNHESMSHIDSKIRIRLTDLRAKVMKEIKSKGLRTTGNLVITFLKDLVDEWLSLDWFLQNNSIFDAPLMKLGFSAFLSLNHFFRTRQISHIIDLKCNFEVAIEDPIEDDTFYLALPQSENSKQFVDYIIKETKQFCKKLQDLSGVIEIGMQSCEMSSPKLRHCYYLSASGTVWSLQILRNLISHPKFFNHFSITNWIERESISVHSDIQ